MSSNQNLPQPTGKNELTQYQSSKNSPKQYWITTSPKTALEAFSSESVSLAKLKKESGEIVTKAFCVFIISELVESFNLGKTMNDRQIAFAAEQIMTDYFFLKIDELKYCFNQATKGRYGIIYDRLDTSILFSWIEKYLEERLDIAATKMENENKEFKAGLTIHPDIASKMKEALKSEPKKDEPKQEARTKGKDIKDTDVFQEFMKEFTVLQKEYAVPNTKGRFVTYRGKILSQEEYCEIRHKEKAVQKN